jgi:hypothetical protein
MPIEGLPDPILHRKCKRCGTWCHLHEGAFTWPPKKGLISAVHVSLAEWTEQDDRQKFYCVACQERNEFDQRRARKRAIGIALTLLMLGIVLRFGLATVLVNFLRGR